MTEEQAENYRKKGFRQFVPDLIDFKNKIIIEYQEESEGRQGVLRRRGKINKKGHDEFSDEDKDLFYDLAKFNQLKIALPSGTGTTALFLQQRFFQRQLPFEVLTCACVGGDAYLHEQFKALSKNPVNYPTIMPANKKHHFGKLYLSYFQMWQTLKAQTGIEFELLYDPLGWLTLLSYIKSNPTKTPILYIHQGGLLGNATMLPRYQRKYN